MKSDVPAISVIMSVYNGEKYLAEAIESILNQTFSDFEFIIVDDGSTDGSLLIIQAYMEQDDRIVLISRDNKGLPYSLNEGVSIAKGRYIARMDADDISLSRRFEYQYDFMEKNQNIGVCGTNAFIIDSSGSRLSRILYQPELHEECKVVLLFNVCFAHPSVMIRKNVLNGCSPYDENYISGQDYELWSRLVNVTVFHNIQITLLEYRLSDDSITSFSDSDFNFTNRLNLISSIQRRMTGLVDFNLEESESFLHYCLSLNKNMKYISDKPLEVYDYISKLLRKNELYGVFDSKLLEKIVMLKFFRYSCFSIKSGKCVPFKSTACFIVSFFCFLKHDFLKRFK